MALTRRAALLRTAFVALGILGAGACRNHGALAGHEGGNCLPNKKCQAGLSCFSDLCVRYDASVDGNGGTEGGTTGADAAAGATGASGMAGGSAGAAAAAGTSGAAGSAAAGSTGGAAGVAGSTGGAAGTAGGGAGAGGASGGGSGGGAGSSGAPAFAFANPVQYAVGGTPYGLALADFDHDLKLDSVTANLQSSSASVLLGNGDGTFRPQMAVPTGRGGNTVVTWDFDNDTHMDIAMTLESGEVAILLGAGDGHFGAARTFASLGPRAIVAGDLNADGKGDVVVTNVDTPGLTVSLGKGDGTFEPGVFYAAPISPPGLGAADFNGDKKLDIVVGAGGLLSVRLGTGDGTLGASKDFRAAPVPSTGTTQLSVADLDGDGAADVVVGNNDGPDSLSVVLGNGDGTLRAPVTYPIGPGCCVIAVGDLDLDGKPDIVEANSGEGSIGILLSKGAGAFQPAQRFKTDTAARSVAVGDLNRDGKPDVAVVNQGASNMTVLINASHR